MFRPLLQTFTTLLHIINSTFILLPLLELKRISSLFFLVFRE